MRRAPVRPLVAALLAALACDAEVSQPVEEPVLALSARDVGMFAPAGSLTPDRARVVVTNNGGGTLDGLAIGQPVYQDATGWLAATLLGDTIELAANAGNLQADTRSIATLDVFLSDAPGQPRTVTIRFDVGLTQQILLSADRLTFVTIAGLGSLPPPQSVTVQNGGTGILTELAAPAITPTSAETWLAAEIDGATAPARVRLSLIGSGIPAPGEYDATVVVSSRIAEPERDSVEVTLIVAPPVTPLLSTDSVVLDAVEGAPPITRHLWVDEVRRRPLTAAVSTDVAWLTATPDPLAAPGRIELVASPAGLSPGTHVGRLTVAAGGGAPVTALVSLRVRPGPAVELGLDQVRFRTFRGGPVPPPQEVRIANASHGTLAGLSVQVDPDADWLSVSPPSSDSAPAAFTLAIDAASPDWQTLLDAGGTITRNVTVGGTGTASVSLPVTVDVRDGPRLVLSSDSVRFRAVDGTPGPPPDSVELAVANAGPGTLAGIQMAVTYENESGWLGVTPGPLTAPAALRLWLTGSPPLGTHRANVSVSSALDTVDVAVTFVVDSLAPESATLASHAPADTIELWSNAVSGPQPRVLLWLANEAQESIDFSVTGLPPWLSRTFTEPNTQSPTGLILQAERDASDPAGVRLANVTIRGTEGGDQVPPVVIPVRFTLAGPALSVAASQVTLRGYVGEPAPAAQSVIVTNGSTGTLSGVRVTDAPPWLTAQPTAPSADPATVVLQPEASLLAGTYAGTATLESPVAVNSPFDLAVTLRVDTGAILAISPPRITLAAVAGDTTPVTDTIVAFNAGRGTVGTPAAPVVTPVGAWLSADWETGGPPNQPPRLIVRANPVGLAPVIPTRTGSVSVSSPEGGAAALEVRFDLVPTPALRGSPAALTFTATGGLPTPADTQTIAVFDPEGRPTGGLTVMVSGETNWFAYEVDSTSVPAAVRVWPTMVPPPRDTAYAATVAIASAIAADTVRSVLAYLVSPPSGPVIEVSRDTLVFDRANPLAQTVEITNGGGGTLRELTVQDLTGTDWLFVLLDSRIAPATLTVAVNAAAAAGEPPNSVAELRVSGEGAEPRIVTVVLR
jgi:hypothetical protein